MSTRHAETGHAAGHSKRGRTGDDAVQRITSAPEAGHIERDARFVRYAWQMGIRTLCFILAFFTTGWPQIVFFAAAIVLPYIAVVLANNGAVSNGEVLDAVPPAPDGTPALDTRRELTAGPETLQGTTTDDDRAA
jgi:hypothetical protein